MRGPAIAFRGTDRFELVDELGSGAMGTVYKVWDRETESYAALKLLEMYGDDDLRRFKREFRALQGIQHRNLVNLGELSETRGVWFFTMELVEGKDFLSYVAPDGKLDATRLRRATIQLMRALEALHRANKVHRDVKPSNVIVDATGRLVVLDFGLILEADNPDQSTKHSVVGTGAYMAPDVVNSLEAPGPAADCYAVGVMLYEALAGELPYTGTVVEIMIKKRERPPMPPSRLRPGISKELEQLCMDLLARDPSERPGTAEVLKRLGAGPEAEEGDDAVAPAFVGRARELERLLDGLREPREAGAMVVEGPSGVGKSTLVRRFQEQVAATMPDAMTLTGRCFEREAVPFKGVDGVVDDLARQLGDMRAADLADLMPDNADLLVRVFPALGRIEAFRETTRASYGDVGPHELRRRAFVALRMLLWRIARARPVVIVVDDIQWMSSDSWALLEQLTQPPGAPAVLLVLTRRPETGRLRAIPGPVEQIALGPLPPHEARALAAELLRRADIDDDGSRAAAIAREAGGHPLFVQQLAEHVAAGGEATGARLEQALAARVARLSPGARELLSLVATAAGPMPHSCMAHALLVDFAEYQRRVTELQVGNYVRTAGMRAGDTIVYYHDRIRVAALADASEDAQKRLHLRLANAVEEVGLADAAPQLAVHHLAEAGLRERAAVRAESAARRAMEILAFEPAAALLLIALDLGTYEGAARRELELRLADALVHAGRGAEAAELYMASAQTGSASERLDCLRRAADQLLITGHLAAGTDVLSAVLASIGESMPRTPQRALASLLVQRGLLRMGGLRWRPRDESAIPPRDLVRLDVYQTVATGLTFVDNIRGADFQCRFLRLALKLGEPTRLIRALSFETAFHATLGNRRRTEKLAKRLAEWSKGADPVAQAYERLAEAGCGIYLYNDWPTTRRAAEQAEHLLRNHSQSGGWETNTARLFKCFSLLHMGKLEHLARLVPVYLREAERRGDLYAATQLRSRLVLPWLAADDPARAAAELDEAMTRWTPWREQYLVQHFFALHSLCEIALYRGDAAAAMAHMREQLPPLKKSLLLRLWMPRGEVDHLRGRIALARKDTDAARRFARALRRNKLPAPKGWALLLEAGAASLDGNADSARALLEKAIAALEPGDNSLYRNAAGVALGRGDAMDWLAREQVRDAAALCRLLVPGFDYRELS